MTNKRKRQYRIRNWRDYNKALVSRGSLTLRVDARALDTWLDTARPARRGRRRSYAETAILCALTLREVYHLPLRSTEGLIRGAYDARGCYRAIHARGARAVIPPRKGSVLWKDEYLSDRNANLRGVARLGARGWKRKSNYHCRSLVETAIFRLKTLFTDQLRSREVERQATEVMIRCAALNPMTRLGMPSSYAL